MSSISPELFENTYINEGKFFIPETIAEGISQYLIGKDQKAVTEEYQRLLSEYKKYRLLKVPAKIDYRGENTLDAYVAYYLPRNAIIPWIAFRDLSLHPLFSNLSEKIRILDIGSGTGAVELGLLHLFGNEALKNIELTIVSIDKHAEALAAQQHVIAAAGYDNPPITWVQADLEDGSLQRVVADYAPFQFIFSANCLTEMEAGAIDTLINLLPPLLDDNGAIVFAEPQRNYTKWLTATNARKATGLGLHVFYPCAEVTKCTGEYCWVWRDHEYRFPSIKIDGYMLDEDPRDILTLSWLILTKADISIYDNFKRKNPQLSWGPVAHKDKKWCDNGNFHKFVSGDILFPKRGSIVGVNAEDSLTEYREI